MIEIRPMSRRYWAAFTPDQTIHTGITGPGLVTTTGQANLIDFATAQELVDDVRNRATLLPILPPLPDIGQYIPRGVYIHSGRVVSTEIDHVRTVDDPTQSGLYTLSR